MTIARVVAFDGVTKERMEKLTREIESGERESPATEMIGLYNPDEGTALAILFFDSEEQFRLADEQLSSMSPEETPGNRTSVAKYNVAVRKTA